MVDLHLSMQFVLFFPMGAWVIIILMVGFYGYMEQGLSESASMELSSAVEEHWNDGALDVRLSPVWHPLIFY